MAVYAIGDVQGCFAELQALLAKIKFNPDQDTLWFTGDLVNRGPDSLGVLRFVKSLGDRQITVLGNHDLHLIALVYGVKEAHASDTLDAILQAPDRDDLIDWLRHCPLLHYDASLNYVMTHAGLAPMWTLQQALSLAKEVEKVLQSDEIISLLENMYGNQPDHWNDQLSGYARLRCITNYLTRMRFCYADGRLDLSYKGEIAGKPEALLPWFSLPSRQNTNEKIIFGHWASLQGESLVPNVFALDTGCVWGNCLTAMRLEDGERVQVSCG